MIIDLLENAERYFPVYKGLDKAFDYLRTTPLADIAPGKYTIDGENLFAIVQEYETMPAANEQMEAHKKYIDVQYMIRGSELVGHALYEQQMVSKEYDAEQDFMLFADKPSFFTAMSQGTFMVFFPTDLHMPCIQHPEAAKVKKVVVKVKTGGK